MTIFATRLLILGAIVSTLAQTSLPPGVTIPATNGSLPTDGGNGCAQGFFPGRDEVLVTLPYPYDQVLSIIGNYTNLTWSGSPDISVTTNASASTLQNNNWQSGDARTYDLVGAHVIETITEYKKDPATKEYIEIHTLAPLSIVVQGFTLAVYAAFDGQVWTPTCGGKAMIGNFTTISCANNASIAEATFHQIHLTDGLTVGKFLGGQNFTACEDLVAANSTGNGTATTAGPTSKPSTLTGDVSDLVVDRFLLMVVPILLILAIV